MTIGPTWRTSSRSTNTGGNCVEVADNLADRVLARDSRDRPGPVPTFGPTAWTTFVTDVSRIRP